MPQKVLFNVVAVGICAFKFIDRHKKPLLLLLRPQTPVPAMCSRRSGCQAKARLPHVWKSVSTHARPHSDDTIVEGGDLASTERDERQVHAGVGYSAP